MFTRHLVPRIAVCAIHKWIPVNVTREIYNQCAYTAFAYIYVVRHVILQGAIMPQCTGAPLTRRGKQREGGEGEQMGLSSHLLQSRMSTQSRAHVSTQSHNHEHMWAQMQTCNFSFCNLHMMHAECSASNFKSLQLKFGLLCVKHLILWRHIFCEMNLTIGQRLVTTSWLCLCVGWSTIQSC